MSDQNKEFQVTLPYLLIVTNMSEKPPLRNHEMLLTHVS